MKSTGQAVGRKEGWKVAETKDNLEPTSLNWNSMKMD